MISRPNILFVTAEDICPNLGCYGDPNARTPNLDRFASEGIRFTQVFSVHPCCSPSRACLATGVYPTTLGTFQHRGRMWVARDEVRCMTSILRENGYYTFNGMQGGAMKTDYNFKPEDEPWDSMGSKDVEWQKAAPGQPFFGQVNLFRTHQSQYGRRRVGEEDPHRTHDPDHIELPPYHPDTPAIREIWAEYHDRITEMDAQFADLLEMLENDGLAENTIVIFLGDNGMGIPAGKVWVWEQGLHVPMIIRYPKDWEPLDASGPGGVDERMVSFVDFVPSVLSLCGIEIPEFVQGQIVLGPEAVERTACYAARDFHDGADFDTSRAVRTRRFHYVRNFMPHLGWDPILYSWDRAPYMLTEWLEAVEEGNTDGSLRQTAFFLDRKPVEELYDIQEDPDCMQNLAEDPAYGSTLKEMRTACRAWLIESGDLGLLTQYELYTRSERVGTPYRLSSEREQNPIEELMNAADCAAFSDEEDVKDILALLEHADSAVRRWGVIGLMSSNNRGEDVQDALLKAMKDESPDVRIAAAEVLCQTDHVVKALDALKDLLMFPDGIIRREVLYAAARLGEIAYPLLPHLDQALSPCPRTDIWSSNNIPEAVNLIKAVQGEPVEAEGSMIPFALTRRRPYRPDHRK